MTTQELLNGKENAIKTLNELKSEALLLIDYIDMALNEIDNVKTTDEAYEFDDKFNKKVENNLTYIEII